MKALCNFLYLCIRITKIPMPAYEIKYNEQKKTVMLMIDLKEISEEQRQGLIAIGLIDDFDAKFAKGLTAEECIAWHHKAIDEYWDKKYGKDSL